MPPALVATLPPIWQLKIKNEIKIIENRFFSLTATVITSYKISIFVHFGTSNWGIINSFLVCKYSKQVVGQVIFHFKERISDLPFAPRSKGTIKSCFSSSLSRFSRMTPAPHSTVPEVASISWILFKRFKERITSSNTGTLPPEN